MTAPAKRYRSERQSPLRRIEQITDQKDYLRAAKEHLGIGWNEFSDRLETPLPSLKNYMRSPGTVGHREMPASTRAHVLEVLLHEELKHKTAYPDKSPERKTK